MKQQGCYLGLVLVAAVFVQGCLTGRGKGDDADAPRVLTKLETRYGYITPQEIRADRTVSVALINVDFSKAHLLFDFNIGSFEPRSGRGDIYLKVDKPTRPLVSLAELQAKLEACIEDIPVGIIMMVDGVALGVGGNTPKAEQNDFFRDFATMMEAAGIKYAYIVPEKITISR